MDGWAGVGGEGEETRGGTGEGAAPSRARREAARTFLPDRERQRVRDKEKEEEKSDRERERGMHKERHTDRDREQPVYTRQMVTRLDKNAGDRDRDLRRRARAAKPRVFPPFPPHPSDRPGSRDLAVTGSWCSTFFCPLDAVKSSQWSSRTRIWVSPHEIDFLKLEFGGPPLCCGHGSSRNLTPPCPTWHMEDSQGQILALSFREESFNPFLFNRGEYS